jgi:hypothetical protein
MPSLSLGLIYVPVCLAGTHSWWHCPFQVFQVDKIQTDLCIIKDKNTYKKYGEKSSRGI